MRPHHHAAVALLLLLSATGASAQELCIPGTSVCAQRTPGGGVVIAPQLPGVSAQGQAQAQGQGQLPPVQLPNYSAEWQAYLQWRADFKFRVQAELSAKWRVEANAYWEGSPNPYAGRPSPPATVISTSSSASLPRMELGLLGLCFGFLTGKTEAQYVGFCPSLRYRFGALGVALDPAFLHVDEEHAASTGQTLSYGLFGLRPGVTLTMYEGANGYEGSEVYAFAGGHGYVPLSALSQVPGSYWGAHAGLGAYYTRGTFSAGTDMRLTTLSGVGGDDTPSVSGLRAFRIGFEARVYVGVGF